MDPMGNFSVLSTLKLIKVLFLTCGEAAFIFISYSTSINAKISSGQQSALQVSCGYLLPRTWWLQHHTPHTPQGGTPVWRDPELDHTVLLHHMKYFSVHDLGLDWVMGNPRLYLMFSHKELPLEQQGCSSCGSRAGVKILRTDYQGLHWSLNSKPGSWQRYTELTVKA